MSNASMSIIKVSPDCDLAYKVDDFVEPWQARDAILMLHGNSESNAAWFAWVPHLARRFCVIRPDMRGFGKSTVMPRDYTWSIDGIIDDFIHLMDHLDIRRFHLVGAKIGGTIALRFAARHPGRVLTLSVLGAPDAGMGELLSRVQPWLEHIEQHGVESWARMTMPGRLGSGFPAEGVEWWSRYMGSTSPETQLGFISSISTIDVTAELPKIQCPTLVITTEGHSLSSVDGTRAWTSKIPRGELLVMPGDSYHVAVTAPDACAKATLDFIDRVSA